MAVTIRDVTWLAGWLEGEGCFRFGCNTPSITATSTDLDVMRKVAGILGGNIYDRKTPPPRKPSWSTHVGGGWAAGWMMTLLPLMGERRQQKIKDVLSAWRGLPGFAKNSCGKIVPASCHPERPSSSLGLCESCYEKQRFTTLPADAKTRNTILATARARERRRAHTPEEKRRLSAYRSAWRKARLSRATNEEIEAMKLRSRENMKRCRQRAKGGSNVCA